MRYIISCSPCNILSLHSLVQFHVEKLKENELSFLRVSVIIYVFYLFPSSLQNYYYHHLNHHHQCINIDNEKENENENDDDDDDDDDEDEDDADDSSNTNTKTKNLNAGFYNNFTFGQL